MRLALVIAILLVGEHARAQTPPTAAETSNDHRLDIAEEHHRKGVEFFEAQDFEAALTEFRASYELSKRPDILFNMALTNEKLGRLSECLHFLEDFKKAAPESSKDAQVVLERVNKTLAAQKVIPSPPEPRKRKTPIGASVLVAVGAALLVADIGVASASYGLSKMVETQPLSLQAYDDAQAQGQRLNQASIALLTIGLSAAIAGSTWHLVAYGRQHKTP